ncbi:MAG: Gfo/Idh/MocA family oxidoreductase [Actinobacteria bacterium]|nr:Gfo/Idh/MocA family oxidoreductase [Actinomycetota bacterium]
MTTRVGVIGAGFAGTTHARACRDIAGARVVAVAAATREEAAPLAAECEARVADGAAELASATDVDLVVVASPTYLHAEHAVAAARAGKQVFCEKPLARTMEQARAIVDACESAGVALAVGHVVRFFPEYDYALATLRFPEGLIAHVESSWAEHAGFRTGFEVCGSAGMLAHDSRASAPLVVQSPDAGAGPAVMPGTAAHESPYGTQLRDLIGRLGRGDAPLVGGRDGLATLSLAFAVDESARTGESVAWSAPT